MLFEDLARKANGGGEEVRGGGGGGEGGGGGGGGEGGGKQTDLFHLTYLSSITFTSEEDV